MTLTLDAILRNAGIAPAEAQAIRHAYVREQEDTRSKVEARLAKVAAEARRLRQQLGLSTDE